MANSDALLSTIRSLVSRAEDRQYRAGSAADPLVDDLLYWVAALDDQLSCGAPLPREWNVRPNRSADVEGWDMERADFVQAGKRFTRLIPNYDRGRARRAAAVTRRNT
ncbi:hypothetical protein LCGC14_0468870 [marine sediment metagenome]|uniref:Uncharacterized protein n=1 Tax=marine sediment metagenome TaxID=412755 RepID=A0A0F9UZJ9_9ZZZZ